MWGRVGGKGERADEKLVCGRRTQIEKGDKKWGCCWGVGRCRRLIIDEEPRERDWDWEKVGGTEGKPAEKVTDQVRSWGGVVWLGKKTQTGMRSMRSGD